MRDFMNRVLEFDKVHKLDNNSADFENLVFQALALSGEVGEAQNIIKKLWYSKHNPSNNISDNIKLIELETNLGFELVDIYIYLVKLIYVYEQLYNRYFECLINAKYEILEKRWSK